MTAIKTNGRSRREKLGQFLTSVPTADFMASMFGPRPRATRFTSRDRRGLLVEVIIDPPRHTNLRLTHRLRIRGLDMHPPS